MRPAAALAVCLLMGGCATAGRPVAALAPVDGYLDAAAVRAMAAAFTPSPLDPQAEQAVSDAVEPGTDRWWLAIAHAELRPPEAAQHFDCVLGTRLAETPRPALTRLMTRLLADSDAVTRRLGELHPRPRPIAVNPDLQPCQRTDAATRNSSSWPAAGAVAGTTYGEMFAALAPDRADALRGRGNDIGRSRAICRMNWPADVDDGLRIGRRVYVHATESAELTADLEAARAEVAAARAEGLTNPGCAAERRALGPTPGGD